MKKITPAQFFQFVSSIAYYQFLFEPRIPFKVFQ